ncbi:alpha-glucan family phosphorylase [Candidatus Woesearchaeota archaeon]|nr:alpha-glucan family phosphorylase [Candidatus Woesearchaeota archaeon]
MDFNDIRIAYFSMEVGVRSDIPTYAGGLGVLAGDALKSAADLEHPMVGITLLYRKGYFRQKITDRGQSEKPQEWNPDDHLKKLPDEVTIKIGNEDVRIGCWLYEVEGVTGAKVPLLFLDTDLDSNNDLARQITDRLYYGDHRHRIAQEMVLGIGGVEMLKKLGCNVEKYHMNEGHSSFLTLALYRDISLEDIRKMCVFTTHTPVDAGHDKFDKDIIMDMVREYIPDNPDVRIFDDHHLNMTHLGLRFSGYVNGVARKHMKVSKSMFPGHEIESISNGIHTHFWAAEPLQKLFDKYIPDWKEDPYSLRSVMNVPDDEMWNAHIEAKQALLDAVKQRTDVQFHPARFTIGFARRFVEYKRPDLIIHDSKRLKKIAEEKGDIQVIFSGKAHPHDKKGSDLIRRIVKASEDFRGKVRIVFLEDYDIETAKLMVSGCDLWLNNPQRPYEASGTSGMKAALNGVPQMSTLDGWWLEGHIEGVTGWSIGLHPLDPEFDKDVGPEDEAEDFYTKLREKVIPMFYGKRKEWIDMMKHCIAINASFFNTHRMMQQYILDAYHK